MENDTAEDGGLHVTAFPFTLLRPYRTTPPAAPADQLAVRRAEG
jgi:hypothetical protein